jgi:cysteinyl-tRNA synthetase
MLRVHNSLTGKLEVFEPLVPGTVRMYVCGITVYDFCHVGHMRMNAVFDVVRRYLESSGYAVTFVRNITDIDDNIINRAAKNGESVDALTSRFIQANIRMSPLAASWAITGTSPCSSQRTLFSHLLCMLTPAASGCRARA